MRLTFENMLVAVFNLDKQGLYFGGIWWDQPSSIG